MLTARLSICLAVFALLCCPLRVGSEVLWENVCASDDSTQTAYAFCNPRLSLQDRVEDYARRIPTAHKIRMMVNDAEGYDNLGIPRYQWWSEGLHGALQPCVCDAAQQQQHCRCPTSFPAPCALGSALNHTLWYTIARTIGQEARAIANMRRHDRRNYFNGAWSDYDGLTYWSPTLNLQRDPRWGRNQESPGEDPVVVSQYAREFVRGLQQQQQPSTQTTTSIQIAACCKHWIGNSLEGRGEYVHPSRHDFSANISAADMVNYYERPFRACIQAGALGAMCSYNAVNGVPSCASPELLKDRLRNDWQFNGYIVSDCGAIRDIVTGHHYVASNATAVARALNAGTDINCGSMYSEHLPAALQGGEVSPDRIDSAFRRLVTVQMQLGLFDPVEASPYSSYGLDAIDTDYSRQLSLEAALQSIVLLKNEEQVLPLAVPIDTLAVIGPHANAARAFLSNYHGQRCTGKTIANMSCVMTPLQAFTQTNAGGTTDVARGCNISTTDDDQIEAAVQLANRSSAIVLLLGLDGSVENEGRDRERTTLPGLQQQLLERVVAVGNPNTVVVLIAGGALSLGRNVIQRIPALVLAPYGGQMGAQAIADVLFGKFNPTGKLTATMYPPDYVDQIPITEMSLTAGVGRTHLYYTGYPDFAFGSGLSYTSWTVTWTEPEEMVVFRPDDPPITLSMVLTNTGALDGGQTVLLFWRPGFVHDLRIQQSLISYAAVPNISPGESTPVTFQLDPDVFALARGSSTRRSVEPGTYELVARVAGYSSRSKAVRFLDSSDREIN